MENYSSAAISICIVSLIENSVGWGEILTSSLAGYARHAFLACLDDRRLYLIRECPINPISLID